MNCHFSRAATAPLLAAVLFTTAVLPICSRAGGGGGAKTAGIQVAITNITATNATGSPLVSMPAVTIGDEGNAAAVIPEAPALGSVSRTFRIAENEITVAQYAAFLNSVAGVRSRANRRVVDSLYNRASMGAPKNVSGISRTGEGTVASPFVYGPIGNGEHPIANMTWLNAARFANWMHNGATNGADTEAGAYTLSGRTKDATGIARNAEAKWWIPSEDEWFKAAYYKGGGTNAGYRTFPTRSVLPPGNSDPAAANQANYRALNRNFCVTQTNTFDRGQNYLTPVGFFTNSPSAYGTFDQAGNVQEWTETEVFQRGRPLRVLRGGSWQTNLETSGPRVVARATAAANTFGFRLAGATNFTDTRLTGNVLLRVARFLGVAKTRVAVGETFTTFAPAVGTFSIVAQAETFDPAAQNTAPATTNNFTLSGTNTRFFSFSVQVISNSIVIEQIVD